MKFKENDRRTMKDVVTRMLVANMEQSRLEQMGMNVNSNLIWAGMLEQWMAHKRPYFNVWPSVLDCLLHTKVDVDPGMIPRSVVHRLGSIEIRIPESHPLPAFRLAIVPPQMYVNSKGEDTLELMFEKGGEFYWQTVSFGSKPKLNPVGDSCWTISEDESSVLRDCLRVALGVMMLAADPRYIEPLLLNRDKGRDLDGEGHERAVKRAVNRGVHGFDIGKQIEVSPHFRRPHFAIRWTGKGRAIPKLVPVKGAVINKKLLEEIPTGYDG